MDSELLEIYTGRFVRVFALKLYTFYWSASARMYESFPPREKFRTKPLVEPSCVLLPVTLKATLLGVVFLSSIAIPKYRSQQNSCKFCGKRKFRELLSNAALPWSFENKVNRENKTLARSTQMIKILG